MHKSLRLAVTAVAAGAMFGTAAFASALIAPSVDVAVDVASTDATSASAALATGQHAVATFPGGSLEQLIDDAGVAAQVASMLNGGDGLGEGQLYVGAAKRNIAPQPDEAKGERWERDYDKCATISAATLGLVAETTDHLMSAGSTWPENPNCVYQGGFGIGPMNPAIAFDEELGLWVRAISISDGDDTIILSIIDGEGWLWEYANKCERCGSKQIGEDVAASLTDAGFPVTKDGIVLAATHSHASPDFIGVWGFVPDWYMEDVTNLIHEAMEEAVTSAVPAVLEIGEHTAREYNSERRDTYRSAEEQHYTWLRGIDGAGDVIATLGAYAAHPTSKGGNDGVAHADWPGYFVQAAEEEFGGIGMLIMTGLGNLSHRGGDSIGPGLVAMMPAVGEGDPLTSTDLKMKQSLWRQPVTNVPLTALGVPGFADRTFDLIPAVVSVGKSAGSPCVSAAEYSVELPGLAVWLGDFALTTGPGELFANATNTIRDESGARIAMPLAQANDALGYMPQSFEIENPAAQQGLGFAIGGYAMVNYEDSYAIDRCTGDMWLETTLDALADLNK
jgi:hypothetical protein